HAIYPHWRGAYYYAVRPKGDSSAALALLYVSRWSDASNAAKFAAIYAKALDKRYHHVHESLQPASTSVDLHNVESLTGTHSWLTEQGPVVIYEKADTVFITESLDQPTTEQLEQELMGSPAVAASR
ncbi:MAG: hypothetical protein JOZ80_07635, partial [Acidobacteriaceae bacterium]|nr:hypothetical protein [Acidobacteriaceae bacterium]